MATELQVNSADGTKSIRALDDANKRRLYEQIRGIEHLEAEIADMREDSNEQKKLLREEFNIDADVLTFVLKRRKKAGDERANFDDTVSLIEEAIQEVEAARRLRLVDEKPTNEPMPE